MLLNQVNAQDEASYQKQFKSVQPIIQNISFHCKICLKYPIFTTLKSIAKIFKLNEIEALFFAYLTLETNWNINHQLIVQHSHTVKDLIHCKYETTEYKQFLLYLLLIAYSIKESLSNQEKNYLTLVFKICPIFFTVYEGWSLDYVKSMNKINLKAINNLYKSVNNKSGGELDYNYLVDHILQIAQGYQLKEGRADKKKLENIQALKGQAKSQLFVREKPLKRIKMQFEENEFEPILLEKNQKQMIGLDSTNDDYKENSIFSNINDKNELGIPIQEEMKNYRMFSMPDDVHNPDEDFLDEINMDMNEGVSYDYIILRQKSKISQFDYLFDLEENP